MILLLFNKHSTVFTNTKYSVIYYMNIIFNMMYLRTSKYYVIIYYVVILYNVLNLFLGVV